MVDPELLDLFTQTIQRKPTASVNGYGQRTYKAPVSHPCHIDGKAVEVVGPEGVTLTGAGTIWLTDYFPDISTADRVVLPDRGGERGLVEVQTVYDEKGPNHTRLVYGAT